MPRQWYLSPRSLDEDFRRPSSLHSFRREMPEKQCRRLFPIRPEELFAPYLLMLPQHILKPYTIYSYGLLRVYTNRTDSDPSLQALNFFPDCTIRTDRIVDRHS